MGLQVGVLAPGDMLRCALVAVIQLLSLGTTLAWLSLLFAGHRQLQATRPWGRSRATLLPPHGSLLVRLGERGKSGAAGVGAMDRIP